MSKQTKQDVVVVIPAKIQKLIEMKNKGQKIVPKQKLEMHYSAEKLFTMAVKNLEFLNAIAKTEPIRSYIKNRDHGINILNNFSNQLSPPETLGAIGYHQLCLTTMWKKTALFYHYEKDFPAHRSDNDYTLVTKKVLVDWSPESIKSLAKLTEKKIWKTIEEWLSL